MDWAPVYGVYPVPLGKCPINKQSPITIGLPAFLEEGNLFPYGHSRSKTLYQLS